MTKVHLLNLDERNGVVEEKTMLTSYSVSIAFETEKSIEVKVKKVQVNKGFKREGYKEGLVCVRR